MSPELKLAGTAGKWVNDPVEARDFGSFVVREDDFITLEQSWTR